MNMEWNVRFRVRTARLRPASRGGELIDKRGFCASCDARFDLVPEMFMADGPKIGVSGLLDLDHVPRLTLCVRTTDLPDGVVTAYTSAPDRPPASRATSRISPRCAENS